MLIAGVRCGALESSSGETEGVARPNAVRSRVPCSKGYVV